jgi:ubiquinone/menaquinone biosynthesis C-methylase UbiE
MRPDAASGVRVSVADTLSKPDVHRAWIENLRTDEVNAFGFAALERVLRRTDLKPGAKVLDAGCGTGTNSIWLAQQGFKVTGADFSDFALSEAKGEGIDYRREDLTALRFENASFDAVFCIGVLMHIPDVEKALQELVRILRPGGHLIIAEANANAPETYAFRAYWKLARKGIRVERKLPGLEAWNDTSAGPLLSRKTSAAWLKRFLLDRGMKMISRTTGELTELYVYSGRIRKLIHGLNRLWFRLRAPPSLAIGNYYLFRKQPD